MYQEVTLRFLINAILMSLGYLVGHRDGKEASNSIVRQILVKQLEKIINSKRS